MKTLRYIILGALAVMATACVQDPDAPMNQPDLPTMSVDESSVTRVSMVVNGIFSKDMTDITEYGVEISETLFEAGGTYKTLVPQEIGADGFSLGVTGLILNQTYFLRAFIGNGYSKLYSSTITQKTPESSVASISDVTIVDNQYFVATIEDNGGRNLEDVGFVWGEVNDRKSIRREKRYPGTLSADGKTITLPMSDIGKGTYYVLAYAEDDKDGTGFSRIPFELVLKDDVPPVKPEPEPDLTVDMGLSVLWSSVNVGAEAYYQIGTHYSWREDLLPAPGWDSPWRLPTRNEIEELIDNCSWQSTTDHDVYGFVATSKVNGNTLFFPAGGVQYSTEIGNLSFGEYWSSELDPDAINNAFRLQISENLVYCSSKYQKDGRLLRPVYGEKENIHVTGISLEEDVISLTVGSTRSIHATVTPFYASNPTVQWNSSNTEIASVEIVGDGAANTSDATITGLSAGTATITVSTADGGFTASVTVEVTKEGSITASKYLTFTSEGTTTISLYNHEGNSPTLYYSYDASNWVSWDYTELEFSANQPLYFCGDNPVGLNSSSKYSYFVSVGDPFSVSGDLMSLLDKDKDLLIIPSDYCFYCLFSRSDILSPPELPATTLSDHCYASMFAACRKLTTAPALPATTLASNCYDFMFGECLSLLEAPELPATSLANECYTLMFYFCSKLTAAPDLPATSLATRCYYRMFEYCSALFMAPELPATTLADSCYERMFLNCSSLSEAPAKLPATTLSFACYRTMFENCTELTTAPELPAAITTYECYANMFSGCSHLNYVKCLLTEITSIDWIHSWLDGVAATGTFVKSAQMHDWTRGPSGIPEGWTVEDEGGSSSGISAGKYLTFQSEGVTKVSLNNVGGNAPVLYYSIDTENWNQWDYSELSFSAGSPLYICGDNPNGFSTYYDKYSAFSLSGNLFSVSGSVMSLLNHEGDLTSIPSNYCFYRLFSGCSTLMSAPDLPATYLKNSCYQEMFGDCSGLTVLPGLPATSLAQACYYSMFLNCSGVTAAPALPATSIPNYSYRSMFAGCTSLTTAPELSATSFSGFECYEEMFKGCTSLESAPELPATLLTNACYAFMFEGCTSLITAPALPATQLTNRCYEGMFKDCTSLTAAPELPATAFSGAPYKNMFMGCTSLVTAPALPATDLVTQCYMNMFTGCTSLTSAPALPATTLAVQCYYEMFSGCTALTKAPDLPAQKLVETCFSRMFQGCSNLNYVKCLATDISGSSCTVSWLSGVASIGTFVKAAKMNDWPAGASGIPEGWTVKNDGDDDTGTSENFDFENWN